MDSTRQQKIGRQIQKDLGEIIQRSPAVTAGALVTITRVNVTSDMSLARVNMSIFGGPGKEEVLKIIKEHKNELRYELGQRIRNQVRIIPELQFFIDDSLDIIERIDNLLKQ
ncbi:MAG TPA: 30S ribosome-binding factor RbfA [Bacteroidales bacterium]|nr:MAG: ribosome-binding factor A [Bacteroidetes bacterium GWE2_42_24]OFY28439.1 MAG: ribosome-binding factor A [Bacteroidetes bacterium GWF2_43_11]PKP23318.1 MAG: ribosome-binding factor A [Bacteroidetes bacterium HGW-Bacteroidetes-22]HAQ65773.1 30S ribosome-binding factor RbfA [Bacteroidales bacterium]HBZ65657.1 30S ribosome-binding factor RbfA [Bacteroidales bacterium]